MGSAFVGFLLAAASYGPAFPGGGGGMCTLDGSQSALATYYRSTDLTGTVAGYSCDGVTPMCLDTGPGTRNAIGTNVSGDILLGPESGSGTTVRVYGTLVTLTLQGQSLTLSAGATIPALQQSSGTHYAQNTATGYPWRVDDSEGLQVQCKTTLPTCTLTNDGSVLPICGTGGARSKVCWCTSDGTNAAWFNSLNPGAGAGTSTTCPAT